MADALVKHPLTFTLILFVLSAIVSVYGQDIRTVLHSRVPAKIREARRGFLLARVATLKRSHNNAYELLWFVLTTFFEALTDMAVWAGIVLLVGFLANRRSAPPDLRPIIWGTLSGPVLRVRAVLRQLANYEASLDQLQTKADKLLG